MHIEYELEHYIKIIQELEYIHEKKYFIHLLHADPLSILSETLSWRTVSADLKNGDDFFEVKSFDSKPKGHYLKKKKKTYTQEA